LNFIKKWRQSPKGLVGIGFSTINSKVFNFFQAVKNSKYDEIHSDDKFSPSPISAKVYSSGLYDSPATPSSYADETV
jgi:hypothetical protein